MCMHKLKHFYRTRSAFLSRSVRRSGGKEEEENDLRIPLRHATSSYYINPSVALMIEAIMGLAFLEYFRSYLQFDLRKPHSSCFYTEWNAKLFCRIVSV